MSSLKDVKIAIENKTLNDDLIIFQCNENNFIANQYINEIVSIKKMKKNYIDCIEDAIHQLNDAFYVLDDNLLNIFYCDTFNCIDINNLVKLKNTVVVCKTISNSNIIEQAEKYIVNINKLELWQIKEYVYSVCEGVDTNKLDWLVSICHNDIFRINQELDKIVLFDKSLQKYIFEEFIENNIFSDLTSFVVFDLINGIIKKDISKINNVLKNIKNIDIDIIGLVSLLYNNFKNVINIQLGNNPTPESTGLKQNQFNAIRYNCNYYTYTQLILIFEFLTSIDLKIKTGVMPIDLLQDYIIIKILSI